MRLAALVAAAVLLAAACRPEGVTVVPESELPGDVYGSLPPTPDVVEEIPTEGRVYLVGEGVRVRLRARTETLQPTASSVQEALMLALLGSAPEPGRALSSEIPEGTRLRGIEVDGTVATVDFSSEFGRGTGQSLALRLAQVVYTLTEEPTNVIGVRLEIDGFPEPVAEPDRPANRGDFREFAPQEAT
jgi:Sporulation and spore germination